MPFMIVKKSSAITNGGYLQNEQPASKNNF